MVKSNIKIIIIYLFLFFIGALGYVAIELAFRGRSHWSMAVAGGICFCIFALIGEHLSSLNKIYIPIIGSLIITAVELVFGVVFNIILKKNVWDYSSMPFNFLGQICLTFSLIWGLLSIVFIPLASALRSSFLR